MKLIYIDENGNTLKNASAKGCNNFPKSNEIISFANGFDAAIKAVNNDLNKLQHTAELYGAGYTLALERVRELINNKDNAEVAK